jgi:CRISPR/Cas system-associated exonuclease Cas4 (RecB family)
MMIPWTGESPMLWLAGYKRNGLPYGLIRLHEFVLRDMIAYFEEGKVARRKIKDARKAVQQALKMAKKKKINPSLKINLARQVLEELLKETDYTRKVIRATAEEMDDAIRCIEEEKVGEILSLVDRSHELFRNKEMEKAMDLLRESQAKMRNKILEKTRTTILGGIHSDVKNLKYELEEKWKKTTP